MIGIADYLRLLPKTELHCHFTSTMDAARFVQLADRYGVRLPTTDPARLFDYRDLEEFLVAFRAAHDVLKDPKDLTAVAYQGVRYAATTGSLRYREYYINPQLFSGLGYRELLDPVIEGLRAAEHDFGVGFRIVVAIAGGQSATAAVELVEEMIANPLAEVVGLGMDSGIPEGGENPRYFRDAYALARRKGLKLTMHVGETPGGLGSEGVRIAIDEIGVDRVDDGYRVMDDLALVKHARDLNVPFAATPFSTTICSPGWDLNPDHRIAKMIHAGLNVSFSSDDAMFFRTDVGREFVEGIPLLGFGVDTAKAVTLAGIEGSFLDEDEKAVYRARFTGEFLSLDALLSDVSNELT